MIAKISPSKLSGVIKVNPSKSYLHRALIIGALLSKKPVKIYGTSNSTDILATINALKALGSNIEIFDDYYLISPIKKVNDNIVIDVLESATTFRIMLCICAFLGVKATFKMKKSLENRPIAPLLDVFKQNNVAFCDNKLTGEITSNCISVDASVSSQFVSGLMIGLALKNKVSTLSTFGAQVSRGYIDITIDVLKSFGVQVTKSENEFKIVNNGNTINEGQSLPQINDYFIYNVEADWSTAANFVVLGAICGDIKIADLKPNSLQLDSKICDIVGGCGGFLKFQDNILHVKSSKLSPFTVNCENIPDLVPILAVLACFSGGMCTLFNVDRLKFKESNRLDNTLEMLTSAGVMAKYKDNQIIIDAKAPNFKFCKFKPINDHRMVMAQTILSLCACGGEVSNIESVNKSFSQFFDVILSLNNKGGTKSVNLVRE